MFRHLAAIWLVLAAGLASAAAKDPVPGSKLRPADPARFHPGLVKLHDTDVREILRLTGHSTEGELSFRKEWLRKIRFDTAQFTRLLGASSPTVCEWTMRTMGEDPGDHTAAIPALLKMARDRTEHDFQRALAARVMGRCRVDAGAVSLLVAELDGASRELRVIFLETIAAAGPAARPSLPELVSFLASKDASAQFHTYRVLRRIEQSTGKQLSPSSTGEHYIRARNLAELRENNDAKAVTESVAVLSEGTSPAFLRCVALLALQGQRNDAFDLVLNAIGHEDEFVSELAANVLKSLPSVEARSLSALAVGVASTNARVRFESMNRLREVGSAATPAAEALMSVLKRAAINGAPPREVGVCLDVLRNIGTNAASASEPLLALLDERSPVYRDIDKHEVDRLRGFIFITLAETSVPENALGAIVSALANTDGIHEFAGASRAAGRLGAKARAASPHLLRALREAIGDDPIVFESFDSHGGLGREYTTSQIEALRALGGIGPTDETTIQAVRDFLKKPLLILDGPNLAQRTPNLRTEASRTLAAMESENAP